MSLASLGQDIRAYADRVDTVQTGHYSPPSEAALELMQILNSMCVNA